MNLKTLSHDNMHYNEELKQSLTRLYFVPFFLLLALIEHFYIGDIARETFYAMLVAVIFLPFVFFAHYTFLKKFPNSFVFIRKFFPPAFDIIVTTAFIIYFGSFGSLLFAIYIWVIISNGVRFGLIYLKFTAVLALLAILFIYFFSNLYHVNPAFLLSYATTIILTTLFLNVLIKRLYGHIEAIEEATRVKEKFMANMSHELRTPLNSIIGFSQILSKKQKNPEFIKLSKQIHTSSISLLHLINDILDLSKIQDSKFSIEFYEFNAYEEVSNFVEQFEGLSAQKNLNFINNISPTLKHTFLGDWQRIAQIILNLISNAIKFTPENGEIIFTIEYKDASLFIMIKDTGIGMDKETQNRIFQPFEQADGSTTRKYGGTGLGLSITHNLVEMMHGKIELTSTLHKGSIFKVTLPLEQLEDIKSEKSTDTLQENFTEEEKENSLQGHILVVEDNKTNQMLVRMLIEDFGLSCDMANDGIEAVQIYSPQKHALVLMDENMPNMNGIEAMKKIKEKFKDTCTPIIALTANAMEGDKEKFITLGMDDYLSKPIDEDKLYKILLKFLS